MTIQEALAETTSLLSDSESPQLDARLLLQKATGLSAVSLITRRNRQLSPSEETGLKALRARRMSHEPMAYILGHREFYDLDFLVDKRVLIPQPDTETLIDAVLGSTKPDAGLRILDVCTGSGCIGITLARHLHCQVVLADLSSDALDVAEANAGRLLVPGQYTLAQGDLLEAVEGMFDLIVSNPPYLTKADIEEVTDEVRHEPYMALDGMGDDGLDLIRALVPQARARLNDGGRLLLECDPSQCPTVKSLLLANGFCSVYIVKDLASRDRVVGGATEHVRAAD